MFPPARAVAAALPLFLLGCGGPQLERLSPQPGEAGVDPDAVVEARFALPTPGATLRLSRPWGTEVPGTSRLHDPRTLRFVADDPLVVDASYVAVLTWDGAEEPTTWTFAVGDPAWDPSPRAREDRGSSLCEAGRVLPCRPDAPSFSHSPPPRFSGP